MQKLGEENRIISSYTYIYSTKYGNSIFCSKNAKQEADKLAEVIIKVIQEVVR